MKQQINYLCICLLLLIGSVSLYGQNTATVKGKVIDGQGEPLIGCSVQLKGSTRGTITDVDGNFSLNVPSATSTLVISYLGYTTKDVKTKGGQTLTITLDENAQALGEVQVIGFGKQAKVTVTGAVSPVGTTDLLRSPQASLGNMLAGNVTGVSSIQYSGQPGADNPDIFVRGIATLNASNSTPLILVDGVERDFFNLDPNEVESISVLKDASATAVFGVRGANGVIIVTTRRGSEGPAKISASTSFGIQMPTRLVDFANSYDYATYYNEAKRNDGFTEGFFGPEAMDAYKNHTNPLVYPDVDWMDMLFKKASFQSQTNVNISGGTNKVRYFTSLGFLTQDGMFKNFETAYNGNFYYNRFNYRTNLDIEFTKSTLLSINLGGRLEVRNNPNVNNGDMNQLFRSLYWAIPMGGSGIIDGKWIKTNKRYTDFAEGDALHAYYGRGYLNNTSNTLNADVILEQKLDFVTKGLSIKIKGSYNSGYNHKKSRSSSIEYYTPWKVKDLTWYTPEEGEGQDDLILVQTGDPGSLSYSEWTDRSRNWYAEAGITYDRKFGKHQVSALALYNQSRGFYPHYNNELPTGYVGFVGRVTYNYNTTYLAEVNAGYNGSENFAPGLRFGFFPSVSAGWVVTNEEFMKGQDVLNYLKIRASYGVVGNDKNFDGSGNPYRFLYLDGQYYTNGGYNFGVDISGNQGGIYEGKLGNSKVSWEKAYKQNYGVDFSVLAERLSFNIDYFRENRRGILAVANTKPAFNAMNLPVLNIGKVDNQGFEVAGKWKDKIRDFSYWVNANVSFAKNKIIYQDEVLSPYSYQWRTGRQVGQNFGKKFLGFYKEGMQVANHPGTLYPGDCVYQDMNGDGYIDGNDDTAIGYPVYPLLTGGVTIGFSWKGLSLSMLFNGSAFTSRMLQETFRVPFGDTQDRSLLQSQFDNRWTPSTATTATLPRASFNSGPNNYIDSDLWCKDASYIRLKNVELAYNFNLPFMKKIGMESLRVYANGYNLLTFDNLKVADPEMNSNDRPAYPVMRIINFGVSVGF